MNTAEQRAKLTRLRDQVDDVKDSVHALYVAAEAGSRLEAALEAAYAQLGSAKANLGRARDALGRGGAPT